MPCPLCDDTGWKPVEIDGVRRVARCDCWRRDVGEKLLRDAQVPPLYKRCDLDNFIDYNDSLVRAVTRARKFVEAFPVIDKGLFLLGKPGLGKTHLAVAVLKQVIREKNAIGLFCGTRELLQRIRSTYNPTTKTTENQVIQPAMDAELLVLDDLGAERPTDWVEETMNLIVNTRYNNRRLTIFTSNYPLNTAKNSPAETLHERVGFRLFSRLHEMCEFLELEGVDYRELGPDPSPEALASLHERGSQAHKDLPARAKGPIRAQLKPGDAKGRDLGWTGGKAGR
jgi:DNA replication protein DnaC